MKMFLSRAVVPLTAAVLFSGCATPAPPPAPLAPAMSAATPGEVAQLLATTYPRSNAFSYVPALSWTGAIRLSQISGESMYADSIAFDVMQYAAGLAPIHTEPVRLTDLAGGVAIWEIANRTRNPEAMLVAQAIADSLLPTAPDQVIRNATGWTDDMFMASSLLARVAAITGEDRYTVATGDLLLDSAERLQREDGIFVHSADGQVAWGRGNGFAALGLIEALTYLPPTWNQRIRALEIYRSHIEALAALQTESGAWRLVVDAPESPEELTVTSMVTMAMARGVRMRWLDSDEYVPRIQRGWEAIASRIGTDGTVRDVCESTAGGDSLRYYLNRELLNGYDDRGGGLALLAAVEVEALWGMGFGPGAPDSQASASNTSDIEIAG